MLSKTPPRVTLLLGVNAWPCGSKALDHAENIKHAAIVDFCRMPGEMVTCDLGRRLFTLDPGMVKADERCAEPFCPWTLQR